MFARCPFAAVAVCLAVPVFAQEKKDDKKEEKTEEKERKGTVSGVVTAKGDNWLEVKADGEEKARRYVPHWRGGAPDKGGGLDKDMVAQIKKVEVNARVRIEWEFEERARVVKLEVLKKDDKKDK
jgi:hypothetical protein